MSCVRVEVLGLFLDHAWHALAGCTLVMAGRERESVQGRSKYGKLTAHPLMEGKHFLV
jgi:hypothetical protein